MQAVVALACGRLGMSIEEAITAATINGAHALGCAEKVGSLEPGKSADLVILNAGHYRDLEHSLGTNLVHLTMKRGKFIYKEGGVAPLPADDFL
jgi:imidazolonepropionase